jgi:hypothetical protein
MSFTREQCSKGGKITGNSLTREQHRNAGLLGGKACKTLYGPGYFFRKWRQDNPEEAHKISVENGKRNAIPGEFIGLIKIKETNPEKYKMLKSTAGVLGGKKTNFYEKIGAEKLKLKYQKIFNSNSVCDRIVIKDNKIIFVEIKRDSKDKLRPLQKEFKEFCDANNIPYEIFYANEDAVI